MNRPAKNPGEFIAGEKISYIFGKVVPSSDGPRRVLSFGLRGEARLVRAFRRRAPGDRTSSAAVLEAYSASGACDKHRDEGWQKIKNHSGRTGVMQGEAVVTVDVPMGPGGTMRPA